MRNIGPLRREDGSIYQEAAPEFLDPIEREATEKIALYLEMARQEALRGKAVRNRYFFGSIFVKIDGTLAIAKEALSLDARQRRA